MSIGLNIGLCLINSQVKNICNHLNSSNLHISTRPDNHNLRSLSAEMFSKFKLQKLANVLYRRGSKNYEREHPTDIISVPLLEHYDLAIRELRTENEQLKSLTTAQYHELTKARAEAFQLREELTLLRDEVAQSRLPVDRTKNAVKFNTSKKNFWECDKASRSQKRKKIRELTLNAVEKLPTEFKQISEHKALHVSDP